MLIRVRAVKRTSKIKPIDRDAITIDRKVYLVRHRWTRIFTDEKQHKAIHYDDSICVDLSLSMTRAKHLPQRCWPALHAIYRFARHGRAHELRKSLANPQRCKNRFLNVCLRDANPHWS